MITANEASKQCDDFLASVLGLGMHFCENLRFNKNNPQQLFSICMYVRILELATGCKALMEKNALIGIPVLIRSMFEADIDLTNLIKCPNYYKRMYASFLKEKIRLTREVITSDSNPYFDDIKKTRNHRNDLKEAQRELDSLTKERNGPISIRCRAEIAGVLDQYLSVYSMMCLDTHNNIRSLEDEHIEKIDDTYRVVVFKKDKKDMLHYLISIPGILLNQTKSLADFLEVEGIEFENYFKGYDALQDNMQ